MHPYSFFLMDLFAVIAILNSLLLKETMYRMIHSYRRFIVRVVIGRLIRKARFQLSVRIESLPGTTCRRTLRSEALTSLNLGVMEPCRREFHSMMGRYGFA